MFGQGQSNKLNDEGFGGWMKVICRVCKFEDKLSLLYVIVFFIYVLYGICIISLIREMVKSLYYYYFVCFIS